MWAHRFSKLLAGGASLALGLGLVPSAVLLTSASAAAEIVVHPPDEVLSEWTVQNGDRFLFFSPEGDRWELITAVEDPAIRNAGHGAFFPPSPQVVRSALSALGYPGQLLAARVFILPFPRRGLLDSSAGERTVYLSPAVVPLTELQIHALVAHEIGHLVHKALLPDWDQEGWEIYRRLRGIEDRSVYFARAAHRNRPHEIFAEDFRVLFGGAKANYSGGIENRDLTPPEDVAGLREFFLWLATPERLARIRPRQSLVAYPNPSSGAVGMALTGAAPEEGSPLRRWLEVFDVQGRKVAQRELPGGLGWNGRHDDGTPATTGIYFLRIHQGGQAWVGKVLIRR
jgi:hypothetical protein